jgi:hypothetical protein
MPLDPPKNALPQGLDQAQNDWKTLAHEEPNPLQANHFGREQFARPVFQQLPPSGRVEFSLGKD